MNKKLSRLISMVLAMVMTLSCFVCSSVEALAATDYSKYFPANVSSDGLTKTWTFTKGDLSSNTALAVGDTLSGITVTKIGSTKLNTNGYIIGASGSEFTVPVPTNSAGTVNVTFSNGKTALSLNGTDISSGTGSFTTTDSANGLLTLTGTDNFRIAEISITLTTGSFSTGGNVDSGPFDCTINVTNEASTDATIVINDNNFKTTANSSDSHTITLDNGNYPITLLSGTEDTYTLVDSEGNANPSLTVDGSAASINVTIKDIYFTALVNVANATDEALEVKLVGNDSTETTPQTVKANSQSTEYSFPKLNAYDDSGAEIVYTVYVGNEVVGTVFYSEAKLSNINITTTTTTTESTSETTTEATTKTEATEATTASAGSVYNHNFETDGTDSSFYTITGRLATNKGSVTYNGTTINKCLKMESSTSIKFTGSGTLTLVFGTTETNKAVKVDGKTYTTDGSGIVTIKLASGTHNITKEDSINLFYMSFVEGDVVIETTTQATTATATEATTKTEATTEATTVDLSKNVVVYNSDGTAVGSYATIQAAVNAETTVENCVIQVKPGNYVEQVRVPATVTVNKKKISKKGITIKKAEGTTGDVVIYYDTTKSGAYTGPAKMYPIVHIEADNVTLSDLTIINPYNVNVGDVTAKDTIEKRAALAVEGNNGTYNNLVLTSVQDTVFLNQKSTNTNTFNNCTIKGATDWICGGGVNVFNDCNFVFYTGDGAQKKNIGYVFAVGTKGNYTVNGGTLSSELPNAASANYYYARAWQDSTPSTDADYPVLHIFALDNQLPTTFGTSGLLGFYGLTGGNTDNYTGYLLKCDFRAYAGTDTNSELIGTVDPSVLSGLISMNDVSEYKFESNENRLLVADYGNQYKTLTRNSIVDAKTYGFVLFENADDATEANAKKQIEAGNAIESTTLFNTIATESGKTYSLADNKTPGTAADGKYFGVGIVKSDTDLTGQTVTVIPYIAFDGSYNVGGTDYDTNITYCFGTAKTITFE